MKSLGNEAETVEVDLTGMMNDSLPPDPYLMPPPRVYRVTLEAALDVDRATVDKANEMLRM